MHKCVDPFFGANHETSLRRIHAKLHNYLTLLNMTSMCYSTLQILASWFTWEMVEPGILLISEVIKEWIKKRKRACFIPVFVNQYCCQHYPLPRLSLTIRKCPIDHPTKLEQLCPLDSNDETYISIGQYCSSREGSAGFGLDRDKLVVLASLG
jgi:hypothetical protein